MSERKPTAIVQLKVRMREPMRAEIEKAAKEAGHSMNAEIIRRLEASQRENGSERYFLDVFMAENAAEMDGLRKRVARLEKDSFEAARCAIREAELRRRSRAADILLRGVAANNV